MITVIDLINCKKTYVSIIRAIDELIDIDSITDLKFRKNIVDVMADLNYILTELNFCIENTNFIDIETLDNLTSDVNAGTNKASDILYQYKKYRTDSEF